MIFPTLFSCLILAVASETALDDEAPTATTTAATTTDQTLVRSPLHVFADPTFGENFPSGQHVGGPIGGGSHLGQGSVYSPQAGHRTGSVFGHQPGHSSGTVYNPITGHSRTAYSPQTGHSSGTVYNPQTGHSGGSVYTPQSGHSSGSVYNPQTGNAGGIVYIPQTGTFVHGQRTGYYGSSLTGYGHGSHSGGTGYGPGNGKGIGIGTGTGAGIGSGTGAGIGSGTGAGIGSGTGIGIGTGIGSGSKDNSTGSSNTSSPVVPPPQGGYNGQGGNPHVPHSAPHSHFIGYRPSASEHALSQFHGTGNHGNVGYGSHGNIGYGSGASQQGQQSGGSYSGDFLSLFHTARCPPQIDLSDANISDSATGYPSANITAELAGPASSLATFFSIATGSSPREGHLDDPSVHYAVDSCPYERRQLRRFDRHGGRCWVIQEIQDPVFFARCQSLKCVNCPEKHFEENRQNRCVKNFNFVVVWVYCEQVATVKIRKERVAIATNCSCKSLKCPSRGY